jgi:hypothetical protein
MSDANDAMQAKWAELMAMARAAGRRVVPHFYDGEHEVAVLKQRKGEAICIYGGNPEVPFAVSIDPMTLAALMPTLQHALNVALGITEDETPRDSSEALP